MAGFAFNVLIMATSGCMIAQSVIDKYIKPVFIIMAVSTFNVSSSFALVGMLVHV
jgi:hypothetical protein